MDTEDRDHFKTIGSASAKLPTVSSKKPNEANSHLDRDPAYCLKRAKTLFSCYRRDEAHDPEVYCAAVAATLADFTPPVVGYVTDPRTGLPSESKFLPNIAEVRAACVVQAGRQQRLAQPKIAFRRDPPPPRPAGDLFVGFDRPRYAEMSAMLDLDPESGRREIGGIWIPHIWYEKRGAGPTEADRIAASRHHFEQECRREGIVRYGGVSPSLHKTLRVDSEAAQ
jgi:hypothetical protein